MRYLLILICCLIPIALCAATITEWYCPKCGSTDVQEELIEDPPIIQKKSMDEYQGWGKMISTLEYRPRTTVLICNKCGYKVEVTR